MNKKLIIFTLGITMLFLSCSRSNDESIIQNNLDTVSTEQDTLILPSFPIDIQFPQFIAPLSKFKISSSFGGRSQVLKGMGGDEGDLHKGVDMVPLVKNEKVVAAADGVIYIHYPPPGGKFKGHPVYGALIVINHGGGIYTLYGHMKQTWVREKQQIKKGESMGIVGSTGMSTGDHLHWEVVLDVMLLLQESINFIKIEESSSVISSLAVDSTNRK